MTRDEVADWMSLVGTEPSGRQREEWVVGRCPLAPWRHQGGVDRNPSFALSVGEGESRASCFSCGFSAPASDLVLDLMYYYKTTGAPRSHGVDLARALDVAERALRTERLALAKAPREAGSAEPWPEWWLESFAPVGADEEARGYLIGRGVQKAPADRYDLRWDAKRRRVVFPVRDFSGLLRGAQGRAVDPEREPRYFHYPYEGTDGSGCWLGEHLLDGDCPVVAVEGYFDLLSVARVYGNVAALGGTALTAAKARRLRNVDRVLTMFDEGEAGNRARHKAAAMLGARHFVLRGTDPGAASEEQIVAALKPLLRR